jgi:hypothetical protein
MRAIEDGEMARLDLEVGARRDLVGRGAKIFRGTDRQPRLTQKPAPGTEHAEIAGENIAARNEICGLKGGAGYNRGKRRAADDILASVRGYGNDEADAKAPRRHDA